ELVPTGFRGDWGGPIALRGPQAIESLQKFYEAAEEQLTEEQRVSVARAFGMRVGVDYDALSRSRRLPLMSGIEINSLPPQGFDIQLHTHRPQLPLTVAGISREIGDNRATLSTLTDGRLEPFFHPSGFWDAREWPILSALGIRTATTSLPGFNTDKTPLLGLRRFLDGQE